MNNENLRRGGSHLFTLHTFLQSVTVSVPTSDVNSSSGHHSNPLQNLKSTALTILSSLSSSSESWVTNLMAGSGLCLYSKMNPPDGSALERRSIFSNFMADKSESAGLEYRIRFNDEFVLCFFLSSSKIEFTQYPANRRLQERSLAHRVDGASAYWLNFSKTFAVRLVHDALTLVQGPSDGFM